MNEKFDINLVADDINGWVPGAVDACARVVDKRGLEIERWGRLPEDVAKSLRDSGLPGLLAPSEFGGAGGDWLSGFAAIEGVSRADGSTGWSLMIGMVGNMLTGYVERGTALEIFSGAQSLYLAGVFAPKGVARAVGQGDTFEISGTWPFATGIHLSDWCCVGAMSRDANGPEVRQFVLPTSAITINPNWDVTGLSGTGSDDVELKAMHVKRNLSFTFDDRPWPDEWLWRVPFFTVASSLMAAAVLGMASSAVDIVLTRGCLRESRLGFGRSGSFESEIASAYATVRSARAFVRECMAEIIACVKRGDVPAERQRATLWLASVQAVQNCGKVLDLLITSEGASAIRHSAPLQQKWRDARAAGQHVLVSRQRLEAIGRVMLGAPPEAKPFL